jgi:hypothetical protein
MSERDLAGHDRIVTGHVGLRIVGTVLELDVHAEPELLERKAAPVDADLVADAPRLFARRPPSLGHLLKAEDSNLPWVVSLRSTGRLEMEDEAQIHGRIEQLVAEERELWERESAGNASDGDRHRLQEVKVVLDQYWDLLRQRRALGESGQDADAAELRGRDVVEGYEQ